MVSSQQEMYETWKKTATVQKPQPVADAKQVTFCEPSKAEGPLVKNQFLMSKAQADAPINGYAGGSLDYETTQSFYHSITANSQKKIAETTVPNPKIDQLSPEVFKPAATRVDICWGSQKYRDAEHRAQLMTTTDRGAQDNFDTEMMEKLRTSKHNIQRTIISEYSNAKNRGTVFTAPKFSSC